jgi:hypothetical protein
MKNGKILGKTKQNRRYEKIDIIFSVVLLSQQIRYDQKSYYQKKYKHF